MKIGIIVHSLSGHTLRFAQLIQSKLQENGHEVELTQVQTSIPVKSGSVRQPVNYTVTNLPDISGYDLLCIGGPVWAFGASPVICQAIRQMGSLKGKKALPFATMGFPLTGMGGKGALRWMSREIGEKHATLLPGVVIPTMFHNFNLLYEQEAAKISQLIGKA